VANPGYNISHAKLRKKISDSAGRRAGIGRDGIAGCASTPYEKSNAAAESTRQAAAEVQTEGEYLGAATGALDDLMIRPTTDFRPQFEAYSRSVDRLYDSIQRVEFAVKRMQRKNADYLEARDKQVSAMNYEITRDHNEARKAALRDRANAIRSRYIERAK